MKPAEINCVFVYGTLKREQTREHAWPHPPRRVQTATTRGFLYDLGDYPALVPGDDEVLGEVWEFDLRHMPTTLDVLDAIEGYAQRADDLYRRVVLDCNVGDANDVKAYGYYYARPLPHAWRIHPQNGPCRWPIRTP